MLMGVEIGAVMSVLSSSSQTRGATGEVRDGLDLR